MWTSRILFSLCCNGNTACRCVITAALNISWRKSHKVAPRNNNQWEKPQQAQQCRHLNTTHTHTHNTVRQPLTHSLTDSLNDFITDSLRDWLTHSLINSLLQWLTHPLTDSSLTEWLTQWLNNGLTHSLKDSLIQWLTDSSITDWLTHSMTDLITYWLTHSITDWLTDSLVQWHHTCHVPMTSGHTAACANLITWMSLNVTVSHWVAWKHTVCSCPIESQRTLSMSTKEKPPNWGSIWHFPPRQKKTTAVFL